MATNTPASVNGTESATMMPVRNPSERKLTAITIPTATANLNRNSPIASSTTCGWLAMRVNSMPTGRSARIAFSATASALPRSITLAPLAMATPSATACAPIVAHDEARRILEPAADLGDVAEPEDLAAGLDRQRAAPSRLRRARR